MTPSRARDVLVRITGIDSTRLESSRSKPSALRCSQAIPSCIRPFLLGHVAGKPQTSLGPGVMSPAADCQAEYENVGVKTDTFVQWPEFTTVD